MGRGRLLFVIAAIDRVTRDAAGILKAVGAEGRPQVTGEPLVNIIALEAAMVEAWVQNLVLHKADGQLIDNFSGTPSHAEQCL
jgi:hypothetical protein